MSPNKETPHLFQKNLFIKNFRNVSELSLKFNKGSHLFIGPNGHGKTNCLEAIALACSLKPMQSLHNTDLIRFNNIEAKILASFEGPPDLEVDISITPLGKKAKVNDHALKASLELAKLCPIVSFIPAELDLVTGSQILRRRALDQAAFALFAEHVVALKSYEKILKNRNRLLKDWPIDNQTLKTFTQLLIREGGQLMYYRLKAIEQLREIFSHTLAQILGPGHHGNIIYQTQQKKEPSLFAVSDLQAALEEMKDIAKPLEQKRKVTMFGPHLDDIAFLLNGVFAKGLASRGQTRALVFSFKLAQMMAIHRVRGLKPIIILDDIVSELDHTLSANLLDVIAKLKTQAFFSSTDLVVFGNQLPIDQVFFINNGALIT